MEWWETEGHLKEEANKLLIGGIAATCLAERYGTPLYITNLDRIEENARDFREAFSEYPKTKILYAYKANPHPLVCGLLRDEGFGADVVSPNEIRFASLEIGLNPKKIVYTQGGKSDKELKLALRHEVMINLDSLDELKRLESICETEGRYAEVSFRINPDINPKTHPKIATGLKESNLGIDYQSAEKVFEIASKINRIDPTGIQMHIGSQILDMTPFQEATEILFDIVGRLKEKDIDIRRVGLGGGLGIPYRKEEKEGYKGAYGLADAVLPIIRNKISEYDLDEPTIWFEPGRYLVGDASIFLTKVTSMKDHPVRKKVFVDSGFNAFPRPMLYGAYHEAIVANKIHGEEEMVDIVGNVCEAHDDLAKERMLPKIKHGDVVAFLNGGAYCHSMNMPIYNFRGVPNQVFIKNGKDFRTKENSFTDLMNLTGE